MRGQYFKRGRGFGAVLLHTYSSYLWHANANSTAASFANIFFFRSGLLHEGDEILEVNEVELRLVGSVFIQQFV
jgi:hypothetical protein